MTTEVGASPGDEKGAGLSELLRLLVDPRGMGKLRLRWRLVGWQGVCPASTDGVDERKWGVLLFPSSGARNHNCDLDLAKD